MKITRTNRNTFKLIQTIYLNIIYSKNTNSLSSLITFFSIGKLISFEYIIEIRGERPTHLAPSSRYQSAVCGIGFCPFFFFLFFFFPRFEIGFRSMQTSPLSFSGARKFFLLCWYIVGHKSCLNVTLRERLSECAQFLTHPSALQE